MPGDPADPGGDALPLSAERRIDAACIQFEVAWQAGRRPSLEGALAGLAGAERSALLRELLGVELHYRSALGEAPTPGEYDSQFPDDPEAVAAAFAARAAPASTALPGQPPVPTRVPAGIPPAQ